MANFRMRSVLHGMILAGLAALAGCQQMGPQRGANAADPSQQQAAQPRAATANAITFHLAQRQAGQGLAQVQVNENTRLYALPQPVLTQADMQRLTQLQGNNGQAVLRFEFNDQGAARLTNIAKQSKDSYFLVSVQGRLVGVPRVQSTYEGGRLDLRVENVAQAQAILQSLRQPQAQTQQGQPQAQQRQPAGSSR